MSKIRNLIALLLIPCLVADPALANFATPVSHDPKSGMFGEQALMLRHPFYTRGKNAVTGLSALFFVRIAGQIQGYRSYLNRDYRLEAIFDVFRRWIKKDVESKHLTKQQADELMNILATSSKEVADRLDIFFIHLLMEVPGLILWGILFVLIPVGVMQQQAWIPWSYGIVMMGVRPGVTWFWVSRHDIKDWPLVLVSGLPFFLGLFAAPLSLTWIKPRLGRYAISALLRHHIVPGLGRIIVRALLGLGALWATEAWLYGAGAMASEAASRWPDLAHQDIAQAGPGWAANFAALAASHLVKAWLKWDRRFRPMSAVGASA